ncbi:MAG: winged helix DNA-binding domain-containing protein [Pseudomonadota bacterium]|nr:winged helix DNA-binding domain-containing protein [Pseudomonadota bacterium]
MPKPPTLDDLRRYAVARTLFKPTTLQRAIEKLGFVQADPIRAPARAQDLILRHRVSGYCAGDLERRYARLQVEEDFLVNYGFLPRHRLPLLHPRTARRAWDAATERKAAEVLGFIRERGPTHPREVEARFAHGRVTNWFGGTSNAATQLLDGMQYRSLLRVVRREGGTRVYAAVDHEAPDRSAEARAMRAASLVDLVLQVYAPLPSPSLGYLVSLLGVGAPQLRADLRTALATARQRLETVKIDATTWYWPAAENPRSRRWVVDERVRLLAPFDPVVWDRRRFELLWGWTYRFEAYTPPARRKLGYYALPMLWGDRVVGWANASVRDGKLAMTTHFAGARVAEPAYRRALADDRARLATFLGV